MSLEQSMDPVATSADDAAAAAAADRADAVPRPQPAAAADAPHALELRVLDGRQGGARAPLVAGASCVLATLPEGEDGDADIVLREDRQAPARVRLTPGEPFGQIDVLAGEVQLGDQHLAAGAQALWAACTPLRIGSSVVAFGPSGAGQWAAVEAAQARERAEAASAQLPPPAAARPRGMAYWLGVCGAVVLFTSAGALAVAHVAASNEKVAAPVPLDVALRASEFSMLRLERDEQGAPVLRGRLDTLAQRARLDAWLLGRPGAPTVQVEVEEQVARDVADIFRVNGVTVRTRSVGAGQVEADANESDRDRLARAEEVARRDVRGLAGLSVVNHAAPPAPPAPPVVDDPGKRIASVVAGDPAYLVTVDGARYFVGAMLPTGHRITAIEDQRVTLELHGQASSLSF